MVRAPRNTIRRQAGGRFRRKDLRPPCDVLLERIVLQIDRVLAPVQAAPLAKNRINMTRIESRPSRQSMWEYVFFIDIDGHAKDRKLAKALAELEKEAAFLKRLGSYPKAVL